MADMNGNGGRNRSGWQVNINTLLAVAALQARLVGLAVFYVPNADRPPDVAGLQARIAELEAAAKAVKPLLALVVILVGSFALGGCAGVVDSLVGRTSAGGGLAASQHVT